MCLRELGLDMANSHSQQVAAAAAQCITIHEAQAAARREAHARNGNAHAKLSAQAQECTK
jgi:hypothetical protein